MQTYEGFLTQPFSTQRLPMCLNCFNFINCVGCILNSIFDLPNFTFANFLVFGGRIWVTFSVFAAVSWIFVVGDAVVLNFAVTAAVSECDASALEVLLVSNWCTAVGLWIPFSKSTTCVVVVFDDAEVRVFTGLSTVSLFTRVVRFLPADFCTTLDAISNGLALDLVASFCVSRSLSVVVVESSPTLAFILETKVFRVSALLSLHVDEEFVQFGTNVAIRSTIWFQFHTADVRA